MYNKKCCVTNCVSTRKDAIMLHKFPTDDKRRNKWLQCLKDENIQISSLKNLFVCQKHFEKRFISETSLKLVCNAYPTLFTPDEITCGTPSDEHFVTSAENVQLHHDYICSKRQHDHTYSKEDITHTLNERKRSSGPLLMQNVSQPGPSGLLPEHPQPGPSGLLPEYSQPGPSNLPQCPNPTKEVASPRLPSAPVEEPALSVLRIEVRSAASTVPEEQNITATPTMSTVKKASRRRIIQRLNKLTPMCRKLHAEFTKTKKQVDYHRRVKRALIFSKENAFEEKVKKLNPYAKKIVEMQINLCTKKKKGRRFTLEEKLIALAIMKQGPKCYRFLHKIFILPSISTLNKMVANLNIEAGINKKFFALIKKEVDAWPDAKKHCSIIFEEMSLGMGLSYDAKHDKINRFIELDERKPQIADHVLVFMARGAVYKWQQPVAYYFCEGATSGMDLKKIIQEIIPAIAETGLNPMVLGCDQGTAFQAAIKSLRQDKRRNQLLQNQPPDNSVEIGGKEMYIIYDPSHLIKGIRNNFLTKDIKYKNQISKWQDIVDVYNTDCSHTEARLLHKLNDEHVIPNKVKKMKGKNCFRVLSKTVAAALSYTSQFGTYVDGTPVSKTLKNTSETVSFFNDLFDSINGATLSIKKAKGKTLRTAVCESSKHHEFWVEAIKKLEEIRFIENGKEKMVPTLKNFVTTLKSFMSLWQVFKNKNLKIMRPR